MGKRGRAGGGGDPDPNQSDGMRRAVVAARVVGGANGTDQLLPPTGAGATQSFGWSSLLSGLPGEEVEEDQDHEGWVERLFGNERSGCTSPPNAGLLGDGKGSSPQKGKRGKNGAQRQRGGSGGGAASGSSSAAATRQTTGGMQPPSTYNSTNGQQPAQMVRACTAPPPG